MFIHAVGRGLLPSLPTECFHICGTCRGIHWPPISYISPVWRACLDLFTSDHSLLCIRIKKYRGLVLETLGTASTSVLSAGTSPGLCFRAHLLGWTTKYERTLPIHIDKHSRPRVQISPFSLLALTLPPFGVLSRAVARVAFGDISITDSYKYPFNRTK